MGYFIALLRLLAKSKRFWVILFALGTINSVEAMGPYRGQYGNNCDEYILGYVQGLVVYNYEIPRDAIRVRNGVVYVISDKIESDLPAEQYVLKLKQALAHLSEVREVVLQCEPCDLGVWDNENNVSTDTLMPAHSLFSPLIADPKWPRFSAAYQYNFKNATVRNDFSAIAGATIPIYRDRIDNIEWEFGLQAAVFSLFDIHSNQTPLINSDYYISIPMIFRCGPWTTMARLYHQSSHLGDHIRFTNRRLQPYNVKFSYDGIDALFSFNQPISGFDFRFYAGGGYLIYKNPSHLKPLKFQAGAEYYARRTFWCGKLRPVAGLDAKIEQFAGWMPGLSLKAGLQLENPGLKSNKLQLMLEAYCGRSFNGQFYHNKIRYLGIGLNAFL
jgi:hypothetical protein